MTASDAKGFGLNIVGEEGAAPGAAVAQGHRIAWPWPPQAIFFEIGPRVHQWDPIGDICGLGLSIRTPRWPYGHGLSDPF